MSRRTLSLFLAIATVGVAAGCGTSTVRQHDPSNVWRIDGIEKLQGEGAIQPPELADELIALLNAPRDEATAGLMGPVGDLPYRPHTMPYRILIAPLRTDWRFAGEDDSERDAFIAPETESTVQEQDEEERARAAADAEAAAAGDGSESEGDDGAEGTDEGEGATPSEPDDGSTPSEEPDDQGGAGGAGALDDDEGTPAGATDANADAADDAEADTPDADEAAAGDDPEGADPEPVESDDGESAPEPGPGSDLDPEDVAGEDQTIRAFEGYEFAIANDELQAEVKDLFENYYLFDEVEILKGTRSDAFGATLLPTALERQSDFLIEFTLRRNKISYTGVNGLYPLGLLTFLVLGFPAYVIPGEDYRADIEFDVRIWHVRSGQEIFSKNHRGTWEGSTADFVFNPRGFKPFGVYTVPILGKSGVPGGLAESDFADVAESIRPAAWAQLRARLVSDLARELREELRSDTFTAVRNAESVVPRKHAVAIGISEYGPKAGGVIESKPRIKRDLAFVQGWLEDARNGFHPLDRTILGDADATRDRILDAFRKVRKSVEKDQVVIYFRGETAIVDDPDKADDDGVTKYLLPYDVDLTSAETIAKTAISFDEIAAILNKDGPEDVFFVESRKVLLLLDSTFPGESTGLQFAPELEARAKERQRKAGRSGRLRAADLGIKDTFLGRQGLLKDEGRYVVMAADFGERLLEIDQVDRGAFAYELVTSLQEVGAKRIRRSDEDRKLDVWADQVFEHLRPVIESKSRAKGFEWLQRPRKWSNRNFIVSEGAGE